MHQRTRHILQIRPRRAALGQRTIILGVLNVTPDSFSDGGLYADPRAALAHGIEMVKSGADWIDVGGESTRPGANPVPMHEELARVVPVIRSLHHQFSTLPISIDTTKAAVAEEAVRAGASIINDVSGLRFDPRLAEVARRYRTALILMHLRGRPETMQRKPFARDVWRSILAGLRRSIRRALRAGVRHSQLIIDPGLGFGKTRRQNFEILARLDRLQGFGLPILVGSSRKSFVQAVARGEGLGPLASHGSTSALARLWPLVASKARRGKPVSAATVRTLQTGDAAATVAAILGGAHIVRVHDVAALVPAVRIADAMLEALT